MSTDVDPRCLGIGVRRSDCLAIKWWRGDQMVMGTTTADAFKIGSVPAAGVWRCSSCGGWPSPGQRDFLDAMPVSDE